jgi:hypothetical protein
MISEAEVSMIRAKWYEFKRVLTHFKNKLYFGHSEKSMAIYYLALPSAFQTSVKW